MQIETRQSSGVLIVTPLEKRIDARVSGAFRLALIDRIDTGAKRLVINLEHVQFMDSSGLGALVSALKRLGRDGEIKVCSPGASIRSMLERTRLDRVMPILDSEEESVDSFARLDVASSV
jgi:anti-sigma B factor antagonist